MLCGCGVQKDPSRCFGGPFDSWLPMNVEDWTQWLRRLFSAGCPYIPRAGTKIAEGFTVRQRNTEWYLTSRDRN